MSQPVGVVLAAGFSTRMGEPKQLLSYGDTTVLGAVVDTALQSRLERVVVVVGAEADAVRDAIADRAVEIVVNPAPERGNLSSLLCAAQHVGGGPLLLMMGDMPGLPVAVIDAHLEAWAQDPVDMRVTDYVDGRSHPLVIGAGLTARLGDLGGPKPLWKLAGAEDVATLPVQGEAPVDLDTPADYEIAARRLDAWGS